MRQVPALTGQQSEVCAAGRRRALAQQRLRRRERYPSVGMIERAGGEPGSRQDLGGVGSEVTQEAGDSTSPPTR
jgi:hypothetical protein